MRLLLLVAVVGACAPGEKRSASQAVENPRTAAATGGSADSLILDAQSVKAVDSAQNTVPPAATSSGLVPVQRNPGQRVDVGIQMKAVDIRGDTTWVTQQVMNRASSRESLVTYMLDSPGGVTAIQRPSGGSHWVTRVAFRGRPMAVWIIGETIAPGSGTPDLSFASIGIPSIVTFWAEGEHEPPEAPDAPDSLLVYAPLRDEMIHGSTVGVTQWPADRTTTALIARLKDLTRSTCTAPLTWVSNPPLCEQLYSALDQAQLHSAKGQANQAKASLDHFISVLTGPSGSFASGVSSSGYWLLVPNADIIRKAL